MRRLCCVARMSKYLPQAQHTLLLFHLPLYHTLERTRRADPHAIAAENAGGIGHILIIKSGYVALDAPAAPG